jgi:hypothetical protein
MHLALLHVPMQEFTLAYLAPVFNLGIDHWRQFLLGISGHVVKESVLSTFLNSVLLPRIDAPVLAPIERWRDAVDQYRTL